MKTFVLDLKKDVARGQRLNCNREAYSEVVDLELRLLLSFL